MHIATRRMIFGLFLTVLVLGAPIRAAHADQASWTATGRTSTVSIERRQYGDVNVRVALYVLIPEVSTLAYPVEGSCSGSSDYQCYSLALPKIGTESCSYSSLQITTRNAITYLLGSCQKACLATVSSTPWGESVTTEIWSCYDGPHVAECVQMYGPLTPGLGINSLSRTSGCMF